jgi:hypothetical protein
MLLMGGLPSRAALTALMAVPDGTEMVAWVISRDFRRQFKLAAFDAAHVDLAGHLHLGRFQGRRGQGEQVALPGVDAHADQGAEFRFRFHTLGQQLAADLLGQQDQGLDHRPLDGVGLDAPDERAVGLDEIGAHLGEEVQVGGAPRPRRPRR